MIVGEVLMSYEGGVTKVYFSPWMPSEGNCAVMCCEVTYTNNLDAFEWELPAAGVGRRLDGRSPGQGRS